MTMSEKISLLRRKSYNWLENNFDKMPEEMRLKFSARSWARLGYMCGVIWGATRLKQIVDKSNASQEVKDLVKQAIKELNEEG